MMMPAANNISASSATPANTTAAGSSCSTSSAKLKGSMLHQQQHGAVAAGGTAALKCPRCDSSNTKFCYYNNYSLSQPRHFCKACKRYWTRGGTLRNVPVGGGCRKNKRAKKPSHHRQHQQQPAAAATSTGSATAAADPPQQQPSQSSATIDLGSFMYSADMNLAAYSRTAAYDALELGGLIPTSQLSATQLISNNLADLQQQPGAPFLNDDYSTTFGSQAASLLVSSLKQQQPTMKAADYQSSWLLPYDASANLGFLKDVKVEGDNNLNSNDNCITEWQASYPFEANGVSDASNLYWTSAIGGAGGWPEAANPSIAHLI